ncbi:MAG TPA: uroporphyrinogen-III synthase [Acidimicrobiia bacterium]|nr:uroporphyrinogen-III synthase [Acidimicrobiia bacterium]
MTRVRIALTSTADRSASLAPLVAGHGMEAVPLPCIEFSAGDLSVIDEARLRSSRSDWLVITSARTVSTLWPEGDMPDVSVAAVGPGAAAAVRAAGGAPSLVGTGGSEELFARLAPKVSGRAVFFPHAAVADLSVLHSLEAAGADLDTLAVYTVRPIAPGDDPVDAVVFGSPIAVRGWFLARNTTGLRVGAIGETTAAALAERGVSPGSIPPEPAFEALVELMAADLRDRSIA